MFAGNPIGDVEFINEEVKKKVETCAKRLDVIKEFASTTDEPASPFRGFYKHLSLGLIQLCCDRRLDYALQVVPSGWINSEHLAKAANDIRSAVSHATNGEIDFAALDAVGKHLFQMPHRLGGQNFHDISNEAPFCFLGNIAAHAHLVKEKLEKFDNSLMEKLELKLALSEDNEEPNWIGGIIGALDDAKNALDAIDSSGVLPSSWNKILSRDDTQRKNSILHLWQEKTHESLKDSLRDGSRVNAMRLKTIECIESARSRWRTIEAIQGGLDFTSLKAIDDDNRLDAAGFRGANYITDAALPVVLRLTLAQPIVTGEGEEKFTFAERMGFQSLWEHRKSGHWGTRRRHDAVMRIFGATMNKLLSGGKTCVFEKDADFSRSCFVEGGKKHRPDMVIDNAFDDNVKIVFDLTNVAPLTRRGTDILAVDNHLEDAEEKKRSSPAWANFVPLDGLTSEFVPFALGWYGDMGEAATSFIRRVVDHHVRDEYTAAWRMRKILAAIQTRHLNILGVYLQNCRFDMESKGPILDRSHGSKWQRIHLCEKACGIKDPPQSFHSSRLCVTQEESLGLYHFHNKGCATSGRLSSGTNTENRTLTQESGDVRSVEGEVCGAVLVDE